MGEAVALLLEAGEVVGGIRVGYQEVTFRWLVPDEVFDAVAEVEVQFEEVDGVSGGEFPFLDELIEGA